MGSLPVLPNASKLIVNPVVVPSSGALAGLPSGPLAKVSEKMAGSVSRAKFRLNPSAGVALPPPMRTSQA
ncbi:MAG TPA: hypothetical protein VN673_03445, partial [Clostridia bacterium]|nr:hypothetical protein [Clostridia bacterium]